MNDKIKRVLFLSSTIIYLILLNTFAFSQVKEQNLEKTKLFKISIYPLIWAASKGNFWITTHYENQFVKRFSYNLVFDYYNWTYKQYAGGIPIDAVKNNQIFYFRPQIRLYPGNKIYHGYHIGLFPLYSYQEIRYERKYAHYYGLGIITGYQFFIKNKYPIEINAWYATHYGKFTQLNFNTGISEKGKERYEQLSFELNLGFPLKRKF